MRQDKGQIFIAYSTITPNNKQDNARNEWSKCNYHIKQNTRHTSSLYEEPEGECNMFCLATTTITALLLGIPPPQPNPYFPTHESVSKDTPGHATTEVRTDVGWVGPLQTFNVIVLITPDPEWHVYWKNPGASGMPTEVEITTPDGFVVGQPMFPRPSIFHGEEGVTYGYSSAAAIFIPVTAPAILQDGQLEFEVTTTWLACKKACVMGEKTNTVLLSTNKVHHGPLHRDLQLSRWIEALPRQLDDLEGGASIVTGNTLHITGETEMRPIRFIGVERKGIRFGYSSEIIQNGDSFRLPVPIHVDFSAIKGDKLIVEGILMFGRKSDDPSYVVHLILDSTSNQHEGIGN